MMTRRWRTLFVASIILVSAGCTRKPGTASALKPTGFGSALIESSGGKQIGATGMVLTQPVVVQVNDDQGTAVAGALVEFSGPAGVSFDPPSGLTDSSGQFSTNVALGNMAGRYQLIARIFTKAQKSVELKIEEIALGYQQEVGYQLDNKYCARCHDPESTAERVSNYDNLEVKPHPFTEGDTLNRMSDADLTAIISHGGPALNKSALMPPYGYTLSKTEIEALIAYIRLISDPPYHASGMVYAQR
ncbi:MAG: c-type cytochrome [Terriglobales bacterium]|jgi:mono/diheme cytochrome c family protein